jgi:hypothetical protein
MIHKARLFIVLSLILVSSGCPVQKGGDNISPVVPGHEPSAEFQQLVIKIVPISDERLVHFYNDLADVIERDSQYLKLTYQIRELNIRAGVLAFDKTGMKGKYPTLGADIEEATVRMFGGEIKNAPITPELRKRFVDFYKAVAWACK